LLEPGLQFLVLPRFDTFLPETFAEHETKLNSWF